MVAYYQHDIAAWMDGTEGLSDGEYRVYHIICQLIYLKDGPIVMHETGIAGRCHQHVLAFRRHFASLIEKRKLLMLEGGKVTNRRASTELTRIADRRRRPPNPPPTPAQPPGSPPGVGQRSGGGRAANPLKNKEPDLLDAALEERREEKIPEARASGGEGPTRAELERELFRRGKQILGKNAGGMITALLKAKQFDVALARSVVEAAATKQDAREYVAGAIRNPRARIIAYHHPGESW